MILRVEENLPIQIIKGFNVPIELDQDINCFILYSYERIIIHPSRDLEINLPYYRKADIPINKYFKYELTHDISKKHNLSLVWSNLNDLSGTKYISFLLRNNNILLREDLTELTTITGTHKKIDISSNTPIIRIFVN